MEEIGYYYGLYKRNRGEQKEEEKKEEASAPKEEVKSDNTELFKNLAKLVVISNARGPELNDHFSRKEQDALHYALADKRY